MESQSQARFLPFDPSSPQIDVGATRLIAQQAAPPGGCLACVPTVRPGVFTQVVDIPVNCLPLPAGATPDCPALALTCSTGTPVATGPGQVSVPNSLTTAPYTQVIRGTNGEVVCSIPVPEITTAERPLTVPCPSTEGVSCRCGVALGPCTCRINPEQTQVICDYSPSTLTVECIACPPVRGMGRLSTPL